MAILDFFRRSAPAAAAPRAALSGGVEVLTLDDPRLAEYLRGGHETVTGQTLNVEKSLLNPAMFRAVSLITNSVAMLPTHLIDKETKEKAIDHPVFRMLHRRPNDAQSAYDFKSFLQFRALTKGNGYARIVRSTSLRSGAPIVARLLPLDPDRTTPIVSADWTVTYRYDAPDGGSQRFSSSEVFHLRGLTMDGVRGVSLVKQARDAIAVAISAQLATGRQFKNGSFVGGALKHPARLSDEAYHRLQGSLAEKEGAENAGKNLILEEGMDFTRYGVSARDGQLVEILKMQVEEIARVTGVPRPLLMVDETSWGSGIEALGQFFVAYALTPWFEAWQQAAERSLLSEEEAQRYSVKFNAAALLRGSLKDQAEYLTKAGGQAPWMHVDEIRDVMDLPEREAPKHALMQDKQPTKEPTP